MSQKVRNTETEAKKRGAVRVRVIRDAAVIFVCLVILMGFAGSRNIITPEPEYAFVGGTSKDVPVYLIGIPVEDEEEAGEAPDETAEEGSGEEDEEDVAAVEVGRLVRGSSVKKLLGVEEVDGVRYCRVDNTGCEIWWCRRPRYMPERRRLSIRRKTDRRSRRLHRRVPALR